jgi:hypothetical protein
MTLGVAGGFARHVYDQNRLYMCKDLSELDKVYRTLGKTIPAAEKLKYCISLIDRTENYLSRNAAKLTPQIRQHSSEIIKAAQKEIMHLAKVKAPRKTLVRKPAQGKK